MTKDDFIKNIVFGYIEKDIQKMIRAEEDSDGYGNLNFPLAYCVISYMESLGSYLNGVDLKFECNIKKYVHFCMEDYSGRLNCKILGDLVRHGLGHDYFSRIPVSKSDIDEIFYFHNNQLTLNSKSLAIKFLASLKNFNSQLEDKMFESRSEEINKKINRIFNHAEVKVFTMAIKENNNYDLKSTDFPLSGASLTARQTN